MAQLYYSRVHYQNLYVLSHGVHQTHCFGLIILNLFKSFLNLSSKDSTYSILIVQQNIQPSITKPYKNRLLTNHK